MALEEEFGNEIPDEEAEKIKTVGEAIDYIDAAVKNNFGFGGTNGSLVFKRI